MCSACLDCLPRLSHGDDMGVIIRQLQVRYERWKVKNMLCPFPLVIKRETSVYLCVCFESSFARWTCQQLYHG